MRLMFVCTGNTCRSPMAVAAWKAVVREDTRLNVEHIHVDSAGLGALPGLPAALHAVAVARRWNVDLTNHRSRDLNPKAVENVDLIVTMTEQQALAVQARCGVDASKVRTLSSYLQIPAIPVPAVLENLQPKQELSADILDPYGGSLEAYEECGTIIKQAVTQLARSLSRPS